ncbi:MAG: hypothetical protein QW203_07025 [Thermoplasmatales archaeon]
MRGIYTYKITLSNTTSTATSPNLQVRLNINFASLISNINADLGNIRFSSDQAGNNLLYAWLESAPQGTFTQGSSVSSYTSSNVWVNLGNNVIPANGSLTIYMQVLSSGTEFDGVYWGANPLWTSTYGQYDNGANVFSFYDNFAGTSLNTSKWQTSVGTGWTVSVDNGLTISGSGTSSANDVYINSINPVVNSGQILEGYINQGNGSSINERGMIGASSSNTAAQVWDYGGSTGDTIAGWSAGKNSAAYIIQSETILNGAYTYLQSISSNSNLNIYSVAITSSAVYTWYNYGAVTSTTSDVPPTPLYVSLSVYSVGNGGSVNMFYQWVRVRTFPPNGTDPVLISIQILFLGNYTSASIPSPEWSVLKGKPYVTVSAKGISNGLSNIPNDGADFGPDTLLGASSPNQYGPPYTQTSGIQEALDASANLNGGFALIRLLNGTFNTNTSIILRTQSYKGVSIIGTKVRGINNNSSLPNIAKNPAILYNTIELDNFNSLGNIQFIDFEGIIVQGFNGEMIVLTSPENVIPIIIKDCFIGAANYTAIDFGASELVSIYDSNIVGGIIANNLYGVTRIVNSTLNANGNSPSIYEVGGYVIVLERNFSNAPWSIIDSGNGKTVILSKQNTWTNSLTVNNSNGLIWVADGDIFDIGQSPAFIVNSHFTLFRANQCEFIGNNTATLFSSTTTESIFLPKDCVFFQIPAISLTPPATPSVPSSGTALLNPNMWPSRIYLNGGNVSEISITINGNTQIIYSSSGSALSGFMVDLPENASITLTYTSAPTWVWIPQ